jgi:ankyrin repeat protein
MNNKILNIILSLVLPAAASDMLTSQKHEKDSTGAEHFSSELMPAAYVQLEHNNLDELLKLAEQNKALNTSGKLDKKIKILQANTAHAQSLLHQGLSIEGKVKFNDNLLRHEYEAEPENDLNPLLLQSIKEDRPELVAQLLEDGADVDCKNEFGFAALGISARMANPEIFKLLLSKNPKIHGESKTGETILHYAVKGNNPKIISALLGTKQLPKLYLDHNSNLDETPLKLAIRNNNPAIFAQLLKVGAQIKDSDLKHEDLIPAINEQISRSKSSTQQKTINKQFLDVAKSSDTSSIINYVCNGADVNARDDLGETALMIACGAANEDTIEQLIKLGANVNLQNYFGGFTATHQAVQSACLPVIKKLVSSKADLTIKDQNSLTPITLAQQINRDSKNQVHNDIEQYLLQAEASRKLAKKLFSASIGLSIAVGAAIASYSIWQKSR